VKKHDPEYFRDVIVPFIKSKMEKSLVDHYLLGDHAKVVEHESTSLLSKDLNALEMCLLTDSLVRLGHGDRAKQFAANLKSLCKRDY